jgi:hypothetical protein
MTADLARTFPGTQRVALLGAKGPCRLQSLQHKEGKGEMTKASMQGNWVKEYVTNG